jgi:hypothetical protein
MEVSCIELSPTVSIPWFNFLGHFQAAEKEAPQQSAK